jgi:hypothetical protein
MASGSATKILSTCRKIEEGAAQLYHLLAEVHREEAHMAALWTKTAREEENHAQQIALVQRSQAKSGATVKVDLEKAEEALRMVGAVIEAYRRESPTVRQALEEAITIEYALTQFHADYAVEFGDAAYRQLFRSMMAADQQHVEALKAALDHLVGA